MGRRRRQLAVNVPTALRVVKVARVDAEGEPAGTVDVPAPYAWLVSDKADGTGNARYLAGADFPLRVVAEGSARGVAVGFLAKVRLDGAVVWGGSESPREVFANVMPKVAAVRAIGGV